jgi:hypothetical protein
VNRRRCGEQWRLDSAGLAEPERALADPYVVARYAVKVGMVPLDECRRWTRSNHQSTWAIAEQVNLLRNRQGTGFGRTLLTGVSGEFALLALHLLRRTGGFGRLPSTSVLPHNRARPSRRRVQGAQDRCHG